MNNNDYTVVPLKKAVVNKYINFAKKQYDEDNIKKQKFIKNFKWKLLAVLLSIFSYVLPIGSGNYDVNME